MSERITSDRAVAGGFPDAVAESGIDHHVRMTGDYAALFLFMGRTGKLSTDTLILRCAFENLLRQFSSAREPDQVIVNVGFDGRSLTAGPDIPNEHSADRPMRPGFCHCDHGGAICYVARLVSVGHDRHAKHAKHASA